MGAEISFTVRGIPIPKGSTKAFIRPGMRFPVITGDNTKTKPWQETIKGMAQAQAPESLWTGAIELEAVFAMPRPKSLPKKVTTHTRKPDLDKLLRALKDALKGVIYRDDSQVVKAVTCKAYSEAPGVTVMIRQL